MKKMEIGTLVILFIAFYCSVGLADQPFNLDIDMSKIVSADGESYEISFELDGDEIKNVRRVVINIPGGKKMAIRNTLGLSYLELIAGGMSYEEFATRFPEGDYMISLFPQREQNLLVYLTHDFPAVPTIIYPSDGLTDVPLSFTIQWQPIPGYSGWFSVIIDGYPLESFDAVVPPGGTSFFVPEGILAPSTEYDLCLTVEIVNAFFPDYDPNDLDSTRCIQFTTAAE